MLKRPTENLADLEHHTVGNYRNAVSALVWRHRAGKPYNDNPLNP